MSKIISCLVACFDSNGAPSLFHTNVRCTEEELDAGMHYVFAAQRAERDGFTTTEWVADETDPGYVPPQLQIAE